MKLSLKITILLASLAGLSLSSCSSPDARQDNRQGNQDGRQDNRDDRQDNRGDRRDDRFN
jgi:hypothetical protein